jgi:hypothetical protein
MTTINETLTDISLEEIEAMTMAQRAERLRNRYSTFKEASHFAETNIDVETVTGKCNIHGEYSQQVKRFNPKHPCYSHKNGSNWRHPKLDELCTKCRAENAKKRHKNDKKEIQQKWFNGLNAEQKMAIQESTDRLKAINKAKADRRSKGDFSYNRAGDK